MMVKVIVPEGVCPGQRFVVSAGGAESGVLAQIGAELLCDQLTTALAPCGLAGLGWAISVCHRPSNRRPCDIGRALSAR